MSLLLASAAVWLTASAPQGGQILAYDPAMFAADACLAPDFEGPSCTQQRGSGGDAPTASAALLPLETRPELELDEAVLQLGDEVTYWCREPECRPPRRIVVPAS